MERSINNLADELSRRNLRPSHQRIKVLEYLMNNQVHPTVDRIFQDLQPEIPTLSKSTVYNTLNHFVEANLVRVINIEDSEARYDINIEDHGHFKCETCGHIYDFSVRMEDFASDELRGFKITDRGIYFKGVCPRCLHRKDS